MNKTEAQIVSYGILYLNLLSIKVAANELVAPTASLEAINRLKWPPPVPLFLCLLGGF